MECYISDEIETGLNEDTLLVDSVVDEEVDALHFADDLGLNTGDRLMSPLP